MSDEPFYTIVGEWPWQSFLFHRPTPAPPPVVVAPPKKWRLVDYVADGANLSRGKARKFIVLGRVKVDCVVETNPDRIVLSTVEVELCTGG
jgi:hypothetical protein